MNNKFSEPINTNHNILPLYIDDGGDGGLPVVFLHSLAGHTGHWAAPLAHLRPHRRAIALDWRGHGRSGLPADEDFSIPALVADVTAAVDRLGLNRFALVAHSAGAVIALAYASRYPDRVAGLLLVDPAGDARQEVPAEQAEAFMEALASAAYAETIEGYWQPILAGSQPEVAEQLLNDLRTTSPRTVLGAFRALWDYDVTTDVQQYRGPASLIITPLNTGPGSLATLRPDWPVEVIEGTGHWLHLDRPEQFQLMLDSFLATLVQPVRN
jgi:pimeloyl-ACP methyl ester carboxylesterase